MSISAQAATLTTMPGSAPPTAVPAAENGALMLWGLVAWASVGMLVAYTFGAFRRRSIVGPDRILPAQSAWDLLIVLCGSFLVTILAVAQTSHLHMSAEVKLLVQNGVANAAASIAIVGLLAVFHSGQLTELGLNPKWIPAGLAGGAATLFVLYPLVSLTGAAVAFVYAHFHLNQPEAHELLQLLSNTHNRALTFWTIALAMVGAPLTEELMYRGLLQTALGRAFAHVFMECLCLPKSAAGGLSPPGGVIIAIHSGGTRWPAAQRWAAVVVTAGIFAAIHMSVAFFFPIFVLALGLGYIYERTGNLWITIAAHGLFNGGQILYFLSSVR